MKTGLIQKEVIRSIAARRDAIKSIRALGRNRALKRAAAKVAKLFESQGATWSASTIVGESAIYITSYPHVKSFALNAHLLGVLESIAEVCGEGAQWSSKDYPQANLREFKLRGKFDRNELVVEINAHLEDGSESCKRVLKSTRTVEVQEFEFQC